MGMVMGKIQGILTRMDYTMRVGDISLSWRRCFARFSRTIGTVVYHESLLMATLSWAVFLDGGTTLVNSIRDSS